MAMRIYTREEFVAELRNKWHLTPADKNDAELETAGIWKTPSGKTILIPHLAGGDSILNEIVEQLRRLDELPNLENNDN